MHGNLVDPFETWWRATPESKLELIDGRLIVGTLAGSRRIAWQLLNDYDPTMTLSMAPRSLWWKALRRAFDPRPRPQTIQEWNRWAAGVSHDAEPPSAGPHGSRAHRRAYQRLWMGLYAFAAAGRAGKALARDFVVRLGENGLTPDVLFVGRERLSRLHTYYLDGPPDLVIEVVLEGSEEQEREVKRRLYARGGVPEYWIVDPVAQEVTFLRMVDDGRYRRVMPNEDGLYRSEAVDGLALPIARLWEEERPPDDRCWPFLPPRVVRQEKLKEHERERGELGWGSLAFAPRVGLQPVAIRFAEYISWCPEARFESYGGGLVIGSREGSRHVLGLLLMTFGLVEIVKLAHPRLWVASLAEE